MEREKLFYSTMVDRIDISFLIKRMTRSVSVVGLGTITSRVFGYARDMLIANKFGATFVSDAFFVAFMIPNLLRQLLGEGALSVSFIPVFNEYLEKKEKVEAWKLASTVINLLLITSFLITLICVFFAPSIVSIIVPGFKGKEAFSLSVQLTRIMFPFMIFICLSALVMGILNACRHFALPAFSPVVLNLAMISSILFLSSLFPAQPIFALAIGVLIGGVGQLLLQIPPLIKSGMKYNATIDLLHPGIRKITSLMIPTTVGLGVTQLNVVVGRILASFLPDPGCISALYYANRLIQLPISLFGVSIATVFFPIASGYATSMDVGELRRVTTWGIKMVIFACLPATVGLIILGKPIIKILFQRGEFVYSSTLATNLALVCYSFGIVAYASLKVLTRAFYAMQDANTPLKIGVLAVFINILLSIILMRWLSHGGLALATSLTAFLNFLILIYILSRRIGGVEGWGILKTFLQVSFASSLMGLCCICLMKYLKIFLLFKVIISVIAGTLVFFLLSKCIRVEESTIIWQLIKGEKRAERF